MESSYVTEICRVLFWYCCQQRDCDSSGNPTQAKRSGEASQAIADFFQTVKISNGHKLYLECHGIGSPTVILESGLRTRGFAGSREARPRVYLRSARDAPNPGEVSRSDLASMPRTALDVVHDLYALLHAADSDLMC